MAIATRRNHSGTRSPNHQRAERGGEQDRPDDPHEGHGRFGVGGEEGREDRTEPARQGDQHQRPNRDWRVPIPPRMDPLKRTHARIIGPGSAALDRTTSLGQAGPLDSRARLTGELGGVGSKRARLTLTTRLRASSASASSQYRYALRGRRRISSLAWADGRESRPIQVLGVRPRRAHLDRAVLGLRGLEHARAGERAGGAARDGAAWPRRAGGPKPVPLRDVQAERSERLGTGIAELDRVLGGGLVPGSLVLLGGAPGIGKSTLAGMALANIGAAGNEVTLCLRRGVGGAGPPACRAAGGGGAVRADAGRALARVRARRARGRATRRLRDRLGPDPGDPRRRARAASARSGRRPPRCWRRRSGST